MRAQVRRGRDVRGRRAVLAAAWLGIAVLSRGGSAQSVLQPGEEIEIEGGTLTLLSMTVQRDEGSTRLAFILRLTAGLAGSVSFYANDQLRVFAAGVPRAPTHTDVVHVRPESAQEFTTAFHLRDRTDDLILQVRHGRTVWRRRIPLPGPS